MEQFLLALCGLPASGKSALADAIQKAMNFNVTVVRTDDWRGDSYYTDWKPEKEAAVRQSALVRVERLIEQRMSVIHDDTNYYTSMRHDLFKVAVKNGCGFAVLHVSTPIDVALRWNRERVGTRVPDSVIERINERFDLPGRRYLWDDAIVEVNMAAQDLEAIIPEIIENLEELEVASEAKSQLVIGTEFQQMDIETRRIVSEFLKEHLKLRGSRKVSEVRRNFLKEAIERGVPVKDVKNELLKKLNQLI
ncbi:MAG: AAA family ATPase [Candidatus Odinarchaeota archaeon]